MGKYVNGWSPPDRVIEGRFPRPRPVTEEESRIAKLNWEVRSLTQRNNQRAATIRKLKAEIVRLKEPFYAAMTVAQTNGQTNGR